MSGGGGARSQLEALQSSRLRQLARESVVGEEARLQARIGHSFDAKAALAISRLEKAGARVPPVLAAALSTTRCAHRHAAAVARHTLEAARARRRAPAEADADADGAAADANGAAADADGAAAADGMEVEPERMRGSGMRTATSRTVFSSGSDSDSDDGSDSGSGSGDGDDAEPARPSASTPPALGSRRLVRHAIRAAVRCGLLRRREAETLVDMVMREGRGRFTLMEASMEAPKPHEEGPLRALGEALLAWAARGDTNARWAVEGLCGGGGGGWQELGGGGDGAAAAPQRQVAEAEGEGVAPEAAAAAAAAAGAAAAPLEAAAGPAAEAAGVAAPEAAAPGPWAECAAASAPGGAAARRATRAAALLLAAMAQQEWVANPAFQRNQLSSGLRFLRFRMRHALRIYREWAQEQRADDVGRIYLQAQVLALDTSSVVDALSAVEAALAEAVDGAILRRGDDGDDVAAAAVGAAAGAGAPDATAAAASSSGGSGSRAAAPGASAEASDGAAGRAGGKRGGQAAAKAAAKAEAAAAAKAKAKAEAEAVKARAEEEAAAARTRAEGEAAAAAAAWALVRASVERAELEAHMVTHASIALAAQRARGPSQQQQQQEREREQREQPAADGAGPSGGGSGDAAGAARPRQRPHARSRLPVGGPSSQPLGWDGVLPGRWPHSDATAPLVERWHAIGAAVVPHVCTLLALLRKRPGKGGDMVRRCCKQAPRLTTPVMARQVAEYLYVSSAWGALPIDLDALADGVRTVEAAGSAAAAAAAAAAEAEAANDPAATAAAAAVTADSAAAEGRGEEGEEQERWAAAASSVEAAVAGVPGDTGAGAAAGGGEHARVAQPSAAAAAGARAQAPLPLQRQRTGAEPSAPPARVGNALQLLSGASAFVDRRCRAMTEALKDLRMLLCCGPRDAYFAVRALALLRGRPLLWAPLRLPPPPPEQPPPLLALAALPHAPPPPPQQQQQQQTQTQQTQQTQQQGRGVPAEAGRGGAGEDEDEEAAALLRPLRGVGLMPVAHVPVTIKPPEAVTQIRMAGRSPDKVAAQLRSVMADRHCAALQCSGDSVEEVARAVAVVLAVARHVRRGRGACVVCRACLYDEPQPGVLEARTSPNLLTAAVEGDGAVLRILVLEGTRSAEGGLRLRDGCRQRL